jgi:ferrochelatase
VKNLIVLTPSFVTDCLETLEEIAMTGKEEFLNSGGKSYKHIPCLNDDDQWVDVTCDWISKWTNPSSLFPKEKDLTPK